MQTLSYDATGTLLRNDYQIYFWECTRLADADQAWQRCCGGKLQLRCPEPTPDKTVNGVASGYVHDGLDSKFDGDTVRGDWAPMIRPKHRHRLVIASAKLLLVLGVTLMAYSFYLHSYYANNYPRSPQVTTCRTVPLNVHGTVVYLTEQESSRLTWIFLGAMVCGLCGGAILKHCES